MNMLLCRILLWLQRHLFRLGRQGCNSAALAMLPSFAAHIPWVALPPLPHVLTSIAILALGRVLVEQWVPCSAHRLDCRTFCVLQCVWVECRIVCDRRNFSDSPTIESSHSVVVATHCRRGTVWCGAAPCACQARAACCRCIESRHLDRPERTRDRSRESTRNCAECGRQASMVF